MDRLWITMTLLVACLIYSGNAADAAKEMQGKGGVIVHVDAADGTLLEKLCKEQTNRIAHAFVRSAETENIIRQSLHRSGMHGRITVSRWDGKTIPFIENFVNLLVCPADTPRAEVLRVLAPQSVALIGDERVVKPRPESYDDWPQYLYDQTGNAVSNDTAVKPPLGQMQWVGGPRWSRHHETMSSVSACVSGNGKVFYIFDEGMTFSPMLPPHWKLIARDAFNGTILWKRDIPKWIPNLEKLKSGPATLPRRVVVVGDKLYVTLGVEAPVSVLDTVTGKTLEVLAGTECTEEIIYDGENLFMVADVNQNKKELGQYPRFGTAQWIIRPKHILRYELATGKLVWKKKFGYVSPMTLAGHLNKLYFFNGKQVQSLEKSTGDPIWTSAELPSFKNMPTFFAPKLVVQGGAVLFAGGEDFKGVGGSRGKLRGLSTETGKVMWTAPNPASGYRSPEDLFVIKGKAWAGDVYNHRWWGNDTNATGEFTGVNIARGTIDKRINHPEAYWFHHRCHMAKATKNYLLMSRTGIEFIDLKTGKWTLHHWIRGACLYGIMPANGMIYAPPHPCACYIGAKTFGFTAAAPLNPNRISLKAVPEDQRLKTVVADAPFEGEAKADEWPTYRGDVQRSGKGSKTDLPKGTKWSVNLGDQLTPPAIAGGKIVVAQKNKFAIVALDAKTGKRAWTFLPGARVDSTPTIYKGRVYFGSADGYVRCLTLDTGKLV